MRHVARQPVTLRGGQRLHQVPAREVGAADIADLAGADQVVKRAQRFLDRSHGVEAVKLEQVDVVGAEALQRPLAGVDEMVSRGADVVDAVPGAKRRLG